MTFISLKDLKKKIDNTRLPTDCILYRVSTKKKDGKDISIVKFIIPKNIAYESGINPGTQLDILYDKDTSICKMVVLRQSGGFSVKDFPDYKTSTPSRGSFVRFYYIDGCGLPYTDNKNWFIYEYEIKAGLIFKLENR